jgi:hypothetical protein
MQIEAGNSLCTFLTQLLGRSIKIMTSLSFVVSRIFSFNCYNISESFVDWYFFVRYNLKDFFLQNTFFASLAVGYFVCPSHCSLTRDLPTLGRLIE